MKIRIKHQFKNESEYRRQDLYSHESYCKCSHMYYTVLSQKHYYVVHAHELASLNVCGKVIIKHRTNQRCLPFK